jgi:hypothetical protein
MTNNLNEPGTHPGVAVPESQETCIDPGEMQTYLYDLQGYLVLKDVLSAGLVAELDALIDAQNLPAPPHNGRFGSAGGSADTGPGFLTWGQPFVDLIDHPVSMGLLRMQLGDCFRLDRIFGMEMTKGMPNGRLHSDYGASHPFAGSVSGQHYAQQGHQALHGFAVIAFNLRDSGPEQGGLRLIPGSHNSRYRLPGPIRNDEDLSVVVSPDAPAGSLTFFSEATTHGTAGWHVDYRRRTLLYKYCASQLSWSRTRVIEPPGVALTLRQRKLFAEPAGAHWFFESLFAESATNE